MEQVNQINWQCSKHLTMIATTPLSYCDLFCGCGGFSIGFKESGFRPLGGIDIDKLACQSYQLNITGNVLNADITDVIGLDFSRFIGERPDIVLASPPCEGFSDANAKRIENLWERFYSPPGNLTVEAIDYICDLDPRIGFIIENVPAIADGELRGYIKDELRRIGYDKIYFNVLRAEKLGSPSKRPRVFISNMKFGEPKEIPDYNRHEHVTSIPVDAEIDAEHDGGDDMMDGENLDSDAHGGYVSVLDAIGDLPNPSDINDIPDHEFVGTPEGKEKEVSRLRWKHGLVRFEGSGGKMKNTWVRLFPFEPAPIVMGKSTFIHPFDNRQLTIREFARLQGFPDYFNFVGNYIEKRNQIGEAVSPNVSRFLAREILKRVDN
ncbi:MAG TPA: DNA cytosine methyltransferase [Candidatus Lokiarchaeia archaeon]|nr:DNA cytosine methyltransferase [Candidatus Lokiarchaeia archaeon]